MENKRKFTFLIFFLIIGGIVLFKDPLVAFSSDFNRVLDIYGVYDTNLEMLKRGEKYCFDSNTEVSIGYKKDASDIIYDDVETESDGCFIFNPPNGTGNYDYWFIDDVYYDSTNSKLLLSPFVYEKPSFSLSCNPNVLSQGEVSECLLKMKYYSRIDNLVFDLNVKDYEIISAKEGNDFENLVINESKYSLVGSNTMAGFGPGKETVVLDFKIRALKNIDVNSNDNIKIENINYKDQIEEGSKDNLSATVKQNKVNKTDKISNPLTSNNALYVLLIIITTFILIVVNKRYKILIKKSK